MAKYLIQGKTLDDIADAINAKTGGSSAMTPAQMVTEIQSIPTGGGEVYFSNFNGSPYKKDVVIPEGNYSAYPFFQSCPNLETLVLNSSFSNVTSINIWGYNTSLKHVVINAKLNTVNNNREFQNDTALETAQIGGIGRDIASMNSPNMFLNCTQNGLTITVYVADNATLPFSGSPWGAINATIIYRSATTGEVISV